MEPSAGTSAEYEKRAKKKKKTDGKKKHKTD